MIKNSVLAVVIPTVLAAGAATAAETQSKNNTTLDMYGEYLASYQISTNETSYDDKNEGDKSHQNFGIKGETPLRAGLTAYGTLEYQVLSDADKARLAFLGVRSDRLGSSIDYGQNLGIINDATSWTESGFKSEQFSENWLAGRPLEAITYRQSNLFNMVEGLDFAIQFQPKSQGDNEDLRYGHGNTWGMSASYTSPSGFGIAGAVSEGGRTDAQLAEGAWGSDKETAVQWATSVKYEAHNMYLAATFGKTYDTSYIESRDKDKANLPEVLKIGGIENPVYGFSANDVHWNLLAKYEFDFGLTPSIGFTESRSHQLYLKQPKDMKYGSYLTDVHLAKYVTLGASYDFTDNISAYMNYKINTISHYNMDKAPDDLKDDPYNLGEAALLNIPANNVLSAGVVYKF